MIRYFDIFAGIGGFRSGLEKAGGFKCVGWCEINKYAKLAYETLYDTESEVFYDDARNIDPNELPDFDLISGGFPCQSYSAKRVIPKKEKKAHKIWSFRIKHRNNKR